MHLVIRKNWIIVAPFTVLLFFGVALSERVSNTSDQCSDLLMLFARGSSENPDGQFKEFPYSTDFEAREAVAGSFFRSMEQRITDNYQHIDYKAISIHNSGNGWSVNGYPAVGVFGFNPFGQQFHNMLNAEVFWWPAGEYRNSVDSGADELAGRVNDETRRCPEQRIVISGYSQGAHVVHEALKRIPQNQRNNIDNVVLFGDPKFIGADYNKYNPFSKPKPYPWHRGSAGLRERGIGDAEIPYVPEDMKYKTISWCHEDDFVCTGLSGLFWSAKNHSVFWQSNYLLWDIKAAFGDGHLRYPTHGVPEATEEIMRNLRSHLSSIEKLRGGLDPDYNAFAKTYDNKVKKNTPIDLMLALNYTGGNEDGVHQYLVNLPNTLYRYKTNFPNMRAGRIIYTDAPTSNPAGQNPLASYAFSMIHPQSTTDNAFKVETQHMYGGVGGGGDYPENHGMAIERAGMTASWRKDAIKRIVIIAERPAAPSYTFNMCGTAPGQFSYGVSFQPCLHLPETINTNQHPQLCSSIIEVISGDTCPNIGLGKTSQLINRDLSDAVLLARSKGFVVDIIQPHTARDNQPSFTPVEVENQLRTLAESTGGLYLKYDVFGIAQLREAFWQILNHQPDLMNLQTFTPGSLLDFENANKIPSLTDGVVTLPQNRAIQLYTTAVAGARSYAWDTDNDGVADEITDGPLVELDIAETELALVKVIARSGPDGSGDQLSQTSMVYRTMPVGEPQYLTSTIEPPDNLLAARSLGSATVTLSWDDSDDGYSETDLLLLKDQSSGLPYASVPASQLIYNFELADDETSVYLQLASPDGESETVEVPIVIILPDITPLPGLVIDDAYVGQTDDKTVEQKEPNSFFSPQPLVPETPPLQQTTNPQIVTASRAAPSTTNSDTIVLSDQDVQTNPQSGVGDINDVKQLFPRENFTGDDGDSTNSGSSSRISYILLIIPAIIVLAVVTYIIVSRKGTDLAE